MPNLYVILEKEGSKNFESSDNEEDAEDDMSQSGDKVTPDNYVEKVSESSCMHNNDLPYDINHNNIMLEKDKVLSKDPFNLCDILNKRKDSGDDLKYPPGFTPTVINVEEVNKELKGATSNKVNEHVNSTSNKLEESGPKGKLSSNNSICSKRVHTGGSVLQLMDELVQIGQTMGYNMEGCMRNIEVIIGSRGECNVETKIESMEFVTIKTLWGLIDRPLDDYAYTWAYKIANKLSKFDRFLVSKGLLASFPYLLALCLDRNLSDHRPILIQELSIDCGPTAFRFFHSRFNLDGFDKMVEDTWKSLATVDSNELNDINYIDSLEAAQKFKVRWAVEGDENTMFFQGILDSKRSQLAIHGTLVDGEWIVDPLAVKNVFLKYFSTQFSSLVSPRDKECGLGFGTNKSPGADGFTFEFFRRYWKLLEHDIVTAVKYFFVSGLFLGISIDSSLTLSHLFFADNAIFVGIWDSLNIRTIVKFRTVDVPATPTAPAFIRERTLDDLTDKEKIHEACDMRATNIVLQGLPLDVFTLVNHHTVANEIWDRVKLLIEGTQLSLQEQESKLYNEFD
ncbi:RNA-directed DNA polymerase, eukaryota [Tanacetum coccineum]|uniref:RNA-directed DNA polymerase, eukaryota n=1 Tax=Tanacetum coccineum TaxID=301880 RepID=A0ABQ5FQW6_9ASTR